MLSRSEGDFSSIDRRQGIIPHRRSLTRSPNNNRLNASVHVLRDRLLQNGANRTVMRDEVTVRERCDSP